MKNIVLYLLITMVGVTSYAQDVYKSAEGEFTIHFVGHGSLYIENNGTIIHVDPFSKVGDYAQLPDADYILITHDHFDHLDAGALDEIIKPNTQIISAACCEPVLKGYKNVKYLSNGEDVQLQWSRVEAVPAYNIEHMREAGKPFHPKGKGNGYVFELQGKRIYVAGDTEAIPEMKKLKDIDIAFLPMNLPYTMTPEMVYNAVQLFHPKILYPYHYGETDPQQLVKLLQGSSTEVKVRDMK